MSVYDFSHQDNINGNGSNTNNCVSNINLNNNNNNLNNSDYGSTNCAQIVRYHRVNVESDYINRGYSSTPQMDLAMQVTRPTSKTAMLVRQRRAMLEQLSCFICKGYLIDATTIDECMDSFCRSCIILYLRMHNNCPKCGVIIHSTNPLGSIRSDKVLQDIVYKLVPGLYDNEMKRRRDFYRVIYGTSSSSSDDSDEDGSGSSSLSSIVGIASRCNNLSSEQYGLVPHPKPFYKPTDSVDLSIEPQTRADSSTIYYDNKQQSIVTCFTGNLQNQPLRGARFSIVDSQQFKTYLRCPARLTAYQLKKFIAAKFNTATEDTIHLLYLNESLKGEYSLIDIAYIYDWRGIEHMRLFYIIERDLGKTDEFQSIDSYEIPKKEKTRQSVGTSTQPVKRVCIDPHPRFYEEPNNNNLQTHPSGRSMRSRPVELTKLVVSSHTPAPIFRPQTNSSKQTAHSNDIFERDVSQTKRFDSNLRNRTITSPPNSNGEYGLSTPQTFKETRSSRKQLNTAEPSNFPSKIDSNINSFDTGHMNREVVPAYQRARQQEPNQSANFNTSYNSVAQTSSSKQIVPFVQRGYASVSTVAGPSQGSMVTLASFTEARSNSVVALSSSSATITGSYKNLLETGNQSKPENQSNYNQVGSKTSQHQQPQMAISIVTERGIIVRRFNQSDASTTSTSSSSVNNSRPTSFPSLPAPPRDSSNNQTNNSTSSNQYVSAGVPRTSTTSSGSRLVGNTINSISSRPVSSPSSSVSQHNNEANYSARHQMKVKPVYKTYVDPTKIKTPTNKKSGYTARH